VNLTLESAMNVALEFVIMIDAKREDKALGKDWPDVSIMTDEIISFLKAKE
jgi:hypothetical protein